MDKSSIRPTTKKVRKNTEIKHGEKDEGGGGVVMIVDMVLELSNGVLSNLE